MHTCKNCGTVIRTEKKGYNHRQENLIVGVKVDKEVCLRCIAIVVNWMSGETLVATAAVGGWE